ncbi:MAG TPA: cupin domain-containing protein [Desulfuromonadaceae bacterium]
MTTATAGELIRLLNLSRHPEGGWFRETYRSAEKIPANLLPGRFGGERNICTAIYFLLEEGDFSALHRIRSDEIWHFYAGASLTLHLFTPQGTHGAVKLGSDIVAGDTWQAVVPAGCWFGAEISGPGAYSLVGCTVAPGFDFADFEMGKREELMTRYPARREIIQSLTRIPE